MEAEVTGLIGRINGRFGDAAWTPIRYVNKSYSRTALAGIYRAADVAMVTPLRDGMNLVAKEYRRGAGRRGSRACSSCRNSPAPRRNSVGALLVNPHETDGVAAALKQALEMPLEERRARHGPMLEYLIENDIKNWADILFVGAFREPAKPRASRWNPRVFRGGIRTTRRVAAGAKTQAPVHAPSAEHFGDASVGARDENPNVARRPGDEAVRVSKLRQCIAFR